MSSVSNQTSGPSSTLLQFLRPSSESQNSPESLNNAFNNLSINPQTQTSTTLDSTRVRILTQGPVTTTPQAKEEEIPNLKI